MPFKSENQRKFFNANRKTLEKQGVDIEEWNQASKGLSLPEHVGDHKPKEKPLRHVTRPRQS